MSAQLIKKVEQVIFEKEVPSQVILTLSLEEAVVLRVLTGSILCGQTSNTLRKYTDSVYNYLRDVLDMPYIDSFTLFNDNHYLNCTPGSDRVIENIAAKFKETHGV